ncbi:MAG: GNAT family N-acetyltransferase [Ardenticatenaceae bacterium]|nr:GNAT family N-acetyltransferase [Ardenticatenaceae bacterium]
MFVIREFNPIDTEYEAMAVVEKAVYPDNADTAANFKRYDENWDGNYVRRPFVVEADDKIVAFAIYNERPWSYAPGKYGFNITVHPDYERRGIGSAVYDLILQEVQQQKHPLAQLNTHARGDKPQSIRFLEKRGFQAVMRWIVSVLDVTQFDVSQYAGLRQKVAREGVVIRPLTQQKLLDPDWLNNVYELDWELTLDEPQPSPPTKQPIEQYVKTFIDDPDLIQDAWFVALDGDGRYLGMTQLYRKTDKPTEYGSGFTGVVRSHRRRGIAKALKSYSAEYAQQQGIQTIRTGNEEKNPMYQLNVQLGFKDLTAELAFQKRFTD